MHVLLRYLGEDVVELQVAVDDALLVHLGECSQDVLHDHPDVGLVQDITLPDEIGEVHLALLQDEVIYLRLLDHVDQLNHVLALGKLLHYLDLLLDQLIQLRREQLH